MSNNGPGMLPLVMAVGVMLGAAAVHGGERRSPVIVLEHEASQHAAPQKLRVRATERGLAVSGWVKRRTPDDMRIRGHVELEVIDVAGAVALRSAVPLHTHNRIPRHQRQVPFATILPSPPEEIRTIRVRHSIAGAESEIE